MGLNFEKRLLSSSICSFIGDNITDVAMATILYHLTKSPVAIASIFIFRFFAIFVSGIIVPGIIPLFKNKKKLLIQIDLIRAFSIIGLIFIKEIWPIYFVTFLNSFLNGLYYPVKQSAIQNIIHSDQRISFISLTQTANNTILLIVPTFCGFALNYIRPGYFFFFDGLSFIISAYLLAKLPSWDQPIIKNNDFSKENQFKIFMNRVLRGYSIIFRTKTQSSLLLFRLFLLFSLSSYDVIKMAVLTNFFNHISDYHLPPFITFSFALGLISTVGSSVSIIASLYCGRHYTYKNIQMPFYIGSLLLGLGILCWSAPMTFKFCWVIYLVGTGLLYVGLSFARVAVHSVGLEITDKDIYIEVTSSSDAISRLWQSGVSSFMVAILSIFTLPAIAVVSGIVGGMAIYPARILLNALLHREMNE